MAPQNSVSAPRFLLNLNALHRASSTEGAPNANTEIPTDEREIVPIRYRDFTVGITRGGATPSQLVSLKLNDTEFMWGGGRTSSLQTDNEKKGWQNTTIIMFPVVGTPTDGVILVDGSEYKMPQHGTYRCYPATLYQSSPTAVSVVQQYKYDKQHPLQTPKGVAEFPFDYTLSEQYQICGPGMLGIKIDVQNDSDRKMPYALGMHPGFLTSGDGILRVNFHSLDSKKYTLAEIKETTKTEGALVLEGLSAATYISKIGTVSVTSDMQHMQAWSPEGQNLICIEPITATSQSRYKYKGELAAAPYYKVLEPKRSHSYHTYIEVLRA